MKRVPLLLSLLLPLFLHAQISYNRYLDTTCTWFEWEYATIFGSPTCVFGGDYTNQIRWHIVGWDSLDGEAWYLLHQDVASTTVCFGQPPQYGAFQSPMPPTSRIREDSSGRIWRKESTAAQVMRYDFRPGLQVADTLWMNDYTVPCAIAAIDTVYLGTEARKRYWCDCSQPHDPHYVIEGIGYFRGLDYPWTTCNQTLDMELRLVCFHKGGDSLILDTIRPCGIPPHMTVGIEEAALSSLSIHWQAADESLLLSALPPGGSLEWTLFDPQGRLLRSGLQADTRIPLPNLSGGLYLFVGRNESGQFAKRFVR